MNHGYTELVTEWGWAQPACDLNWFPTLPVKLLILAAHVNFCLCCNTKCSKLISFITIFWVVLTR